MSVTRRLSTGLELHGPLEGPFLSGGLNAGKGDSGEAETDFQATDTQEKKDPLSDISKTLHPPLKYRSGNSATLEWEKVNEVTWKLTDGTMTNVPASHGQWGGYRVTKPVAWVIDVGPQKPAWIARHKDQCTNPTDLRQAKAAAMAMAKGADGAYRIRELCRPPQRSRRTLVRCGAATFEWRTQHSPPLPVHGGDV